MEQITAPAAPPANPAPEKKRRWALPYKWPWENPVIMKELKGRMRDRRTFLLLTFYLLLIGVFVASSYFFMVISLTQASLSPDDRQVIGKVIFGTCVLIELLLVSFIAPGLTSGAITSEREHQTLDLLKTTLLTSRELVFGKLGSAIVYLFLLIFTVLPIQSMAFIVGGVGSEEAIISTLMLIVTAVFFSSLGIFFSSIFKRTLAATVASYGSILLSFIGIIFFFFILALVESAPIFGASSISADVLTLLMWFIVSTNPILAAIFTEAILIDNQSIFLANSSFLGTGNISLLSPWIIFTVFHVLLTAVMLTVSVLLVKRPER